MWRTLTCDSVACFLLAEVCGEVRGSGACEKRRACLTKGSMMKEDIRLVMEEMRELVNVGAGRGETTQTRANTAAEDAHYFKLSVSETALSACSI
jgi:hypothetical protein